MKQRYEWLCLTKCLQKNLEKSLKKWLQPTQAPTTNPEDVGEPYFQNYHIIIYKMFNFQQEIMLENKVWLRERKE